MVNIIGHRGAAGIAPENTIPGFRQAVEIGVDGVEFDVRRAADGTLVILHDAQVDRTTDGAGAIEQLDLATLQSLDAGNGAGIPTLPETVQFFSAHDVELHIDLKTRGVGTETIDLLIEHHLQDRTIVFSSLPDEVAAIATDEVRTGYSVSDVTTEALDHAASHHVDFILGPARADRTAVERIQAAGLLAGLSTINDRDELETAIELRPYSVLTDRPDLAVGRGR